MEINFTREKQETSSVKLSRIAKKEITRPEHFEIVKHSKLRKTVNRVIISQINTSDLASWTWGEKYGKRIFAHLS